MSMLAGRSKGKFSRDKGKRGERELANKLKQYGFKCERSQQYSGKGESSADVINLPSIHIECKRVEKLNISTAIKQAADDCKGENMPAVFHRKNGEGWLVTMPLDEWMMLYREYHSGLVLKNQREGA